MATRRSSGTEPFSKVPDFVFRKGYIDHTYATVALCAVAACAILALTVAAFARTRRRGDPARNATRWLKLALPMSLLGVLFAIAAYAMEINLSKMSRYAAAYRAEDELMAQFSVASVGLLFERLVKAFVAMMLASIGRGMRQSAMGGGMTKKNSCLHWVLGFVVSILGLLVGCGALAHFVLLMQLIGEQGRSSVQMASIATWLGLAVEIVVVVTALVVFVVVFASRMSASANRSTKTWLLLALAAVLNFVAAGYALADTVVKGLAISPPLFHGLLYALLIIWPLTAVLGIAWFILTKSSPGISSTAHVSHRMTKRTSVDSEL